ncbi:MAG: hypothetical protein M3O36_18535 [Myxococcota bacterium]|nr:hypothetical protein [Myxococcota bacterium]
MHHARPSAFVPSLLAGPGTILAVVACALIAAVLPTALYLYVEPRVRARWGLAGDRAGTRRAPRLVRFTAWLSFVVGQLALPWLAVPIACSGLLYLQAKLGVARPFGLVATLSIGVMAFVQSLLALRLLPLGVRLLARDARLLATLRERARWSAGASSLVLGGCAMLGWVMTVAPGFVHPWLRTALVWSAVRPAMAYAAACLLHALLLGRCAVTLSGGATGPNGPRP